MRQHPTPHHFWMVPALLWAMVSFGVTPGAEAALECSQIFKSPENLKPQKTQEEKLAEYLKLQSMTQPSRVAETFHSHALGGGAFHKETKEEALRRYQKENPAIKTFSTDRRAPQFHTLPPGRFDLMIGRKRVRTEISTPFEMMTTPVTQLVWRQVAEMANSLNFSKHKINPDPSRFKGDLHPVEQVSYQDVHQWIKHLNKFSYAGDEYLNTIFKDHKPGDRYRLPTEAEWEYVTRNLGQTDFAFSVPYNMVTLLDYVWYEKNSGGTTHPVALKLPLQIDDMNFYDLEGNVAQWISDDKYAESLGNRKNFVARGGSIHSTRATLEKNNRLVIPGNTGLETVGFRLVREPAP